MPWPMTSMWDSVYIKDPASIDKSCTAEATITKYIFSGLYWDLASISTNCLDLAYIQDSTFIRNLA